MPRPQPQSYPGLDQLADRATRQAARFLWDAVHRLEGRDQDRTIRNTALDLSGQRIQNLADPTSAQDAVTVAYADAHYGARAIQLQLGLGGDAPLYPTTLQGLGGAPIYYGLHADRVGSATYLASSVPDQSLFLETDRTTIYQARLVAGVASWIYLGGTMRGTIDPATANQKPTDLGVNDVGFLFYSTDFDHTFRWSGSVWAYAPGETPSYMVMDRAIDASPGTGWQLLDGSTVTVSNADGTVTTGVTVPNLTTLKRFRRADTAVGATGGSATTHTHPIDPPNTTTGSNSASQEVFAGVGVTVADDPHEHDVNIAPFTSGTPSGTSGDDALPPYYTMKPYMRL